MRPVFASSGTLIIGICLVVASYSVRAEPAAQIIKEANGSISISLTGITCENLKQYFDAAFLRSKAIEIKNTTGCDISQAVLNTVDTSIWKSDQDDCFLKGTCMTPPKKTLPPTKLPNAIDVDTLIKGLSPSNSLQQ